MVEISTFGIERILLHENKVLGALTEQAKLEFYKKLLKQLHPDGELYDFVERLRDCCISRIDESVNEEIKGTIRGPMKTRIMQKIKEMEEERGN